MSTGGSFSVSIPTPVSVANGGTGGATLPTGAVIIGNGTGAVTTVAPGANGNVLVVAAGAWSSAPPAAAGAPGAGTYIVQIPNGSLPNAQALSVLATGLLKSTTATGVLSIATGSDLPAHSATLITSGTLALARGGTNADLSGTGGVNQFLKQVTAAGAVTVAVISAADIATALTTSTIAFSTVTGIVPVAQGGAGVSLSGTGGANQFVKQVTLGGTLTVAGIVSADLTTALTTPPAIGGTTPAAITGTTGVFNTSLKTPIVVPPSDTTTAVRITKADGSTNVGVWDTTNSRLGVGVTPSATFHGLVADANTASAITMLSLAHNLSSGTAAAGIGVGVEFFSHTSGTGAAANTAVGKIEAKFGTTNHPTRNGTVTIYANFIGTAMPIIAASGGTAGYGALAFFGQPGQNAWNYVSRGINTVANFTTGAVDPTAARLVDLNTLRTAYNLVVSQTNDIINMLLGYGLWFVQD